MVDLNGDLKNIAIYTRVSTEDQAKEGFSLDDQMNKLRMFCNARSWNITGEYIEEGKSGRNTKRPEYQRLLTDIKQWDGVLVMKMDRIHRNSKNFMKMMEDLHVKDKQFISMTESLDTSTAMGRFVMDIIQRIAQLESDQLGERTHSGMYQKAKDVKAGFMGHQTPYGYSMGDDGLVINPHIGEVRVAFDKVLKGTSIIQTAKDLEIPNSKVQYFIHNPFYAGYAKYEDVCKKTLVDPVITIETFNKVQIKISKNVFKANVRSKPLILPTDGREIYQIPRDIYFNLSSVRNIGSKKPKHIIGY